jgi:diguanylate cyclase (GGDEF)-like protein
VGGLIIGVAYVAPANCGSRRLERSVATALPAARQFVANVRLRTKAPIGVPCGAARPHNCRMNAVIRLLRVCAGVLLLGATAAHGSALDGEPLQQRFTPADFKATPYLFGLTGDADGRIYVGNNDGVLRFQGHDWQTVELAGGMAGYALGRGIDGRVYLAGYDSFGVLDTAPDGSAVYRDLRNEFGLSREQRALGWFWQILPVRDGVYFYAQGRLLFYRFDGHHRQWPVQDVPGQFTIWHDQLYYQRKDTGLMRFVDGRFVAVPGGEVLHDHTGGDFVDQTDSPILATTTGFFRLSAGRLVAEPVPPMPADVGTFSVTKELPDGGFVVGTQHGFLLEYDAGAHLLRRYRISHNSISALYYDAEKGLWASCGDEMVRLLLPSAWNQLDVSDIGGVVTDGDWHDGALWLVVDSRGLARLTTTADGQGTHVDWIDALAKHQVFNVASTQQGLLIARDEGIDVITGPGIGPPQSLVANAQAVFQIRRSRFDPSLVFAPGDEGVYLLRSDGEHWRKVALLTAPELAPQSVEEVAPGVLWVNNARGLPERWRLDTHTDKLLARERFPLHAPGQPATPEQGSHLMQLEGTVYASIGRATYRFDGHAFVPFNGPPFSFMESPAAFDVEITPVGDYAYTGTKLYRRDRDGRWRREYFGAKPPASQSFLRYGSDGVLRLSTWRGLLQSRPGAATTPVLPPLRVRLVEVARLRTDGLSEPLLLTHAARTGDDSDAFEQDQVIRLDYTVITAEPGVEYRYRVPGLFDEWSGWREQSNLSISGIGQPGDYRVEIQARAPSGRNVQPLQYAFRVVPRWYQQHWLQALAALLVLLGLARLVRWRERQQRLLFVERQQQLEEKISERTAALETANRKLAELATEDSLTGVANRRALETGLQREWLRCQDLCMPISALMIDVDRFKEYNDRHGHLAGDVVLRAVAQRLAGRYDPRRELLARFGGEEFCLLLPGVVLAEARQRAENLRQLFTDGDSEVTVSIGVAARVPAASDGAEALLRAADQMLYEAKRRGRNCVVATDDA